jgi:hypothetical protein
VLPEQRNGQLELRALWHHDVTDPIDFRGGRDAFNQAEIVIDRFELENGIGPRQASRHTHTSSVGHY